MKNFLIIILACAAINVSAQEAPNSLLSIPGMADAVAQAVKHSRAVGLLDLNGKVSGGSYVPLRTLHDAAGVNYLALGIGGSIAAGENFKPRALIEGNLSATTRKLESKLSWYENHITKVTLPDFWLGLSPAPPMDKTFTWQSWKKWVFVSLSAGF